MSHLNAVARSNTATAPSTPRQTPSQSNLPSHLHLHSLAAVVDFAERLVGNGGGESDEEDSDECGEADDDGEDSDGESFHSARSRLPSPTAASAAWNGPRWARRLTIAIPPDELSCSFPTQSLLCILASPYTTSVSHLQIAHTDLLLALSPDIHRLFLALSSITHLTLSGVGPLGCQLLHDLNAQLETVDLEFEQGWVNHVISASFAKSSSHSPPPLPSPTLGILPDPIPLLAHSMHTLRTLRASNAIVVTVADNLRYPAVRTLALRLAGVPTVTPLVHAFPAVADVYVYTPFDGCAIRAPAPAPAPAPSHHPVSPTTPTAERSSHLPSHAHTLNSPPGSPTTPSRTKSLSMNNRLRPPMPSLRATREANRTSQMYSSFPPLARVRGFAPGLYALGLSCPVARLEVGAISCDASASPRLSSTTRMGGDGEGEGENGEVGQVRELIADTHPRSVGIGFARGWWSAADAGRGRAVVLGKERERERARGRERCGLGLGTIFAADAHGMELGQAPGHGHGHGGEAAWPGVSELVVRIEEPGLWPEVTDDLLAMLLPLANSLTHLVLYWDRTSVPFDRVPDEDADEEEEEDSDPHPTSPAPTASSSMPTGSGPDSALPRPHHSPSRAESFARRIMSQMSAIRYIFFEIVHSAPLPDHGLTNANGNARASPISDPRRFERRYWRVDRSEAEESQWSCLDPLGEADARRVLDKSGLGFEDRDGLEGQDALEAGRSSCGLRIDVDPCLYGRIPQRATVANAIDASRVLSHFESASHHGHIPAPAWSTPSFGFELRAVLRPTPRQTALVCYDWLPRSQLSLFRDIEISLESDFDILLRTFSDAPHLADLVEGVYIFTDKYIPFARLVNPQLLRNCVRLSFVEVPWNLFPARYADHSLRPFDNTGITHLNIELERSSCDSLLHCLYTLPLLQELMLSAEAGTQFAEDVLALLHDRPCPFTNLKRLRLWGCASIMTFPPFLWNPDSITHLELFVDMGISETILGLVRSLTGQLQHLCLACSMSADAPRLWTESDAWRIRHLLAALRSLQGRVRAGLTRLTLGFHPDTGRRYRLSRDHFLDYVLGCRALRDTLHNFPVLSFLFIYLYEDDVTRYSEKWWTSEIATRYPTRLSAAIYVDPFHEPGMSRHYSAFLWRTDAQVRKALEQGKVLTDNAS
ncbi:hypothetical protein C8Q74DRAFT_1372618 [Fomes fomentarius]|nr:hypothetical protein C8Q74DRAFT_1372618 [Fomes fomentarius]